MKVAILSDTHGLLRPEVTEKLNGVDAILHAGDIGSWMVEEELAQYAPVYAVRGNNDWGWASHIPCSRQFSLEGVSFYLIHDRSDVPRDLAGVDMVVFGHSHRYTEEEREGVLWFNPGSCGPRRFGGDVTMALMTVEQGTWEMEKVTFAVE